MRLSMSFLLICLLSSESLAGNVRGEISAPALAALEQSPAADRYFWRLGSAPEARTPALPAMVVLESPDATNLRQVDPARPEIRMEGYGLWPSTIAVRVGSTLAFVNLDDHPYSCEVKGGSNSFKLDKLGPGKTHEHKFLAPGVLYLRCRVYPFMRATILVTESPLVAAADTSGHFDIRDVPPGSYTARVFAGGSWRWDSRVMVAAAGVTLIAMGPRQATRDDQPEPAVAPEPPPPKPVKPPGPRVANKKPRVANKKPRVANKKPPAADKKPPPSAQKRPPSEIDIEVPDIEIEPPAADEKPPAVDKKPPAADEKPPKEKKPVKKKKKRKKPPKEPEFKDVEPDIEIEIDD